MYLHTPQAAGIQQIAAVEIGALKTRLTIEQELITDSNFINTLRKFIQATLIYIYILSTFFYGAVTALFVLTYCDAIAQPSFPEYFAMPLSHTNNILLCTAFFLLQLSLIIYPIATLRKTFKHFGIHIHLIYLLILPITLPINELFYKVKSLFLKNKYRRRL